MKISEYLKKEEPRYGEYYHLKSLRYTDAELRIDSCPRCGNEARLLFKSISDPPCHYTAGYIMCSACRIRTQSRCLDGYDCMTDTINDLLDDWNIKK